MTADVPMEAAPSPARPAPAGKTRVRRHSAVTRITHWINVAALFFLLVSGLQIFNAHPALYWGQKSTFASPWMAMYAVNTPEGRKGFTKLGAARYETTGLFGASKVNGVVAPRGFPSWLTLPPNQNLAAGRNFHFFFAWIFVINGLVYLLTTILLGHLKRDLLPTGQDLRHIGRDIADHARLRFPKGRAALRYNVIQKITYLAVVFIILPMMVLTGLTMSPGMDAAWPWLLDLFGGRQSARSLHFIGLVLLILFVFVHVLLVLITEPLNLMRSMITGKFAVEPQEPPYGP